jgi:ADP-ribose pyrophosphatase YjhB (NUDIX family)
MENFKFLLHRIFGFFRYGYFRLIGRSTLDVRAIVVAENQKVLLVKHTYMPGWYLPGGLVERGESLLAAVQRELYEETGIRAITTPTLFNVYLGAMRGVANYPAVFVVNQYQLNPQNSPEIKEMAWFTVSDLPHDTSPATRRRLMEYFQQQPITEQW